MALIKAAMESARKFEANAMSVRFITSISKHAFPSGDEIPDLKNLGVKEKRNTRLTSLVLRYRKKYPLCVSDFTDSEWCEKRAEFVVAGQKTVNEVMQVGRDRHAELEEEPVKKVVYFGSPEGVWANKLLDFVNGTNQLLSKGVTRELPLIGIVEGEWVTGIIDEIQMPSRGSDRRPLLVDIKTRSKRSLPPEVQQRNGRLQLMLYKHMWDSLVSSNFPTKDFFERFSLNPLETLSEYTFDKSRNMGLTAKTLKDITRYFTDMCSMFHVSQDEMIIRYESQKDKSLIREHRFENDPGWFMKQIRGSLEFWRGEREANYVPEEERWKCRICEFESKCPVSNANIKNGSTSSSTDSTKDDKPSNA